MRLLITGSTGFIGRNLVPQLLTRGIDLSLLVRNTPTQNLQVQNSGTDQPQPKVLGGQTSDRGLHHSSPRSEKGSVEIFTGDILDPTVLRQAISGCDGVIHLAAFISDFSLDQSIYAQTNEQGTQNVVRAVLEESRLHPIRLVHFSTSGVLPLLPNQVVSDEIGYAVDPEYPYIKSKINAEKFVLEAFNQARQAGNLNFTVSVARPTLVYGPGDLKFIPGLIKALAAGTPVLLGKPSNQINLIYLDNLIDIIWLLLTRPEAVGRAFLCDDGTVTWDTLVEKLLQEFKLKRPPVLSVPFSVGLGLSHVMEKRARWMRSRERPDLSPFIVHYLFSNVQYSAVRLKKELGYTSRVSFADGLHQTFLSMKS